MEPEEYIAYFEDTILSRTPKSGQKGCSAKVSTCRLTGNTVITVFCLAVLSVGNKECGPLVYLVV